MAEELNNPLFEDEREFLERKKQEYERALRGDVEHIKEQGTQVGKVALVGAGLAGSVWLITKALGGGSKRKKSKQKKNRYAKESGRHDEDQSFERRYDFDADEDFDLDDEAFSLDRSAEFGDSEHDDQADLYASANDFRNQNSYSARESAQAFGASDDDDLSQQADLFDHNDDLDGYDQQEGVGNDEAEFDNGFGSTADHDDDLPQGRLDFGPAVHQHRQGQQPRQAFAYDDSCRLPKSDEFSAPKNASDSADYSSSQDFQTAPDDVDVAWPSAKQRQSSLGKRVGSMVMSFLGTTTGKAVAAQATAAVLAYVTNKMNDKPPVRATGKNADLANASATTSFYGSTPPPTPPSPAVSLTYTDAPTEHPAS